MPLKGSWRITEMDLWERDDIDLVGPAFIEFRGTRSGRLGFIAVEGQLDCRHGSQAGRPFVEFTWDGWDEGDQVGGRGWAALEEDGSLRGHIFFHLGDDSGFRVRTTSPLALSELSRQADLEA
jgi:hypothetical protein